MSRHTIGSWLALILTCGPVTALGSTTYYVNGTCGNNAWSGTSPGCAAPNGPKATIQAAINVAANGDDVLVAPATYPERIDFHGKGIAVRSAAGPDATVIDAAGTGTVVRFASGEGPGARLDGFTITGGSASQGGGMVTIGSSPTVRNCVFTGNEAEIATCMRNWGSSPFVDGCTFAGNTAIVEGTIGNSGGDPVFKDCVFRDNVGQILNFLTTEGPPQFVNCQFISNVGGLAGGAVDGANAIWVNCVFSRDQGQGPRNTSFDAASDSMLINCTISDSLGDGIVVDAGSAEVTIVNSIIWGSTFSSIYVSHVRPPTVSSSDIQGGWPGTGNLDADPLFVQPGTDDVRLSFGSPCVNAGNTAALPADELDLDGDGNTAEPIPVDLAGGPRVLDGVVDMGAYEGQFAPGAPAAGEGDLDQGEFTLLVPVGGPLDPLTSAAVIVSNISGGNNATATVTQIDWDLHPGAGGYSDISSVLVLETSLADGQFLATLFIPFDSNALGGAVPQRVRATWYDPSAGNWGLAVWGDSGNSPGHAGPIGDRIYAEAPAGWGLTQQVGDHGVFWDPQAGKGFAWAHVDHASDFGVGISPCPADCRQTPDGQVNIVDVLALLGDWGSIAGGPCDVDNDGLIGAVDFAALLGSWGPCTVPALRAPGGPAVADKARFVSASRAGSADLNGSGAVDRGDLDALMSCWGANEPGCLADLDGDGTVGVRDYLELLAAWGEYP